MITTEERDDFIEEFVDLLIEHKVIEFMGETITMKMIEKDYFEDLSEGVIVQDCIYHCLLNKYNEYHDTGFRGVIKRASFAEY